MSAHPFLQQKGCKALLCSRTDEHRLFIHTFKEPLIDTHTRNCDKDLHHSLHATQNGGTAVGTGSNL
jgi:hypothetical protein